MNDRRYVAYIRKSTDVEDKQELSLDAQKRIIEEYASRHNLNIIKWYRDKMSAKSAGRPDFGKMIDVLGKATQDLGLIVHKPDRLTRNLWDSAKINELMDKGVDIVFVTGSYPNNAQGKLMFNISTATAKWYIDNLSEETKKGQTESILRGFFPGVPPPGYLTRKEYLKLTGKESDKRERDPTKAPIIKRAFEYYDLGKYSLDGLVEWAYEQGFRGKSTSKRSAGKVGAGTWYNVLKNPFYYGYFKWNGKIYKGTHEPIVDYALWLRVQDRLKSKGHRFQRLYLFPYKLKQLTCGECGAGITAEQKYQMFCTNCRFKFHYPGKIKCPKCKTPIKKMDNPQYLHYIFYHCTKSRFKNCTQQSVRHEYLEKAFEEALERIIMPTGLDEIFKEELRQGLREEQEIRDVSLQNLRQQRGKVKKMMDNLLDLSLKTKFDPERFEKRNEEFEAELRDLDIQIDKYEKLDEKWFKTALLYLELSSRAKELFQKASNERKNELLSFVFQNLVLKDKKVDITYKKPFDIMVKCQQSSTQLPG